tara:strand:+ start:2198 stop:2869 length:672 start_codon:yes stop_codon:yes gene_type:complete
MNKVNHIAFIMDGNGRWGKRKGKSRNFGHIRGVDTVKKIVEESIKLKIPSVSFYVFSTENWKRPKSEINFLFSLISLYFRKEIKNVRENGIKINIIGNLDKIPKKFSSSIKKTIKETKKNKKITVTLAINYGSKSEIINAIKKIKKEKIYEDSIRRNLQTNNLPDPDILIRTGGRKRLSNFMLWQLAYTELYFLDKLWPDFTRKDLYKIVKDYKSIKRNFGAI